MLLWMEELSFLEIWPNLLNTSTELQPLLNFSSPVFPQTPKSKQERKKEMKHKNNKERTLFIYKNVIVSKTAPKNKMVKSGLLNIISLSVLLLELISD